MRYVVTDARPVTLGKLDEALKSVDSNYAVKNGELYDGTELFAKLDIDCPPVDEEMEELLEDAEDAGGDARDMVLKVLRDSTAVLAVRVLWQGREAEPTLQRIDPLWEWLYTNRSGLMQADGEGYYDSTGLVLAVS